MRSAAVVMREWEVPTYIVGKNLIDSLDPVAMETKTRQKAELGEPALIVTLIVSQVRVLGTYNEDNVASPPDSGPQIYHHASSNQISSRLRVLVSRHT